MDPDPHFSPYLRTFFATLVGVWLLTAAIDVAVDPYGIFGTPRIAGLNAIKPSAPERIGVAKPYYAERAAPHTVISGSSRAEAGLDPASPCWDPAQRPVFNMGIPGASFPDQIRYLGHASAPGDVRNILIGIDYIDFLPSRSDTPDAPPWPGPPTDLDQRLRARLDGSPNPGYRLRQLRERLTAIFSLETLADSLLTLMRQDEPDAPTRRTDGFNPALDYRPIIRNEGQSVLFAQKNRETVAELRYPSQRVLQGAPNWSRRMETLARTLQRARRQGVAATVFINPYHADYLTAIALTGHWPRFEAWKRTLTAIADREGVPLWDFNAFDPTTEEQVPPPGDRTHTLRWFWEPAHYRREYGERMLAAMLGRDCAPGTPPAGTRLAMAGIEDHLAALRRGLRAYVEDRPESVRRLGFSPQSHNIQ